MRRRTSADNPLNRDVDVKPDVDVDKNVAFSTFSAADRKPSFFHFFSLFLGALCYKGFTVRVLWAKVRQTRKWSKSVEKCRFESRTCRKDLLDLVKKTGAVPLLSRIGGANGLNRGKSVLSAWSRARLTERMRLFPHFHHPVG